tara:strand:- start:6528 stop:7121 length:594 start_codon:yes stop_codon:yes gene_type:complete
MNSNILIYILVILIIILAIRIFKDSETFNLRCIISDRDGNRYCVRDRTKLELAADRLATVNINLKRLIKHLKEKYPQDERVNLLIKNYNPRKIYETLPTSEYTAYSENKGEKIAFCLDTEKNNKGRLIDINTLMYVALHELSHVATKSVGHNDEFWNNFKFLIIEAKNTNIYNPVDYKNKPARYCGTNITDNPYYDV